MRTTLDLDEQLVRRAKKAAAERGTTLAALIEAALVERLARLPRTRRVLRTFRGDGLQPGVELNRTAALLDVLDAVELEVVPFGIEATRSTKGALRRTFGLALEARLRGPW